MNKNDVNVFICNILLLVLFFSYNVEVVLRDLQKMYTKHNLYYYYYYDYHCCRYFFLLQLLVLLVLLLYDYMYASNICIYTCMSRAYGSEEFQDDEYIYLLL